jgi:hypothetical protein
MRLSRLLVLLLVLPATPARASEELRQGLGQLARAILSTIGEKSSIKVGIFALKTSDLPGVNSGPGLELLLTRELESRRQGVVQAGAPYEVTGDYLFAQQDRLSSARVIKIRARICDSQTGDEIQTLALPGVSLADNKSITDVLQPTVQLPPGESREQRNQRIEEAARRPQVHIHGPGQTLISASATSPFAVEIRARPLNDPGPAVPRRAEDRGKRGQAFVDVRRGEVYEVVVWNRSGKEVAVTLSIDGIDNFHFMKERKNGRPELSHWIMARDRGSGKPQEELRIPGWLNSFRDPRDTYLSFLVVGYGQGAVSKEGLKARGDVGVIRVGIFETYPLREGDTPKGSDETGFGPAIGGEVRQVRYGVGVELESVAVRYMREPK